MPALIDYLLLHCVSDINDFDGDLNVRRSQYGAKRIFYRSIFALKTNFLPPERLAVTDSVEGYEITLMPLLTFEK